jgi:putative redox protein
MVEISIAYDGSLRCTSIHGPSGSKLPTDAPRDNMGMGESFSPTDLLATSLGSCMLTTMAIVARKSGFELGHADADVKKEMVSAGPRRISRLAVTVRVRDSLTPPQQEKMRDAALNCPVKRSIHPEIEVPVTFEFA